MNIDIKDYPQNTKVHLCKTCRRTMPICSALYIDIVFGSDTKHGLPSDDNVLKCVRYDPIFSEIDANIMNLIDFRYWFCGCRYIAGHKLVISADCKKHDKRGVNEKA